MILSGALRSVCGFASSGVTRSVSTGTTAVLSRSGARLGATSATNNERSRAMATMGAVAFSGFIVIASPAASVAKCSNDQDDKRQRVGPHPSGTPRLGFDGNGDATVPDAPQHGLVDNLARDMALLSPAVPENEDDPDDAATTNNAGDLPQRVLDLSQRDPLQSKYWTQDSERIVSAHKYKDLVGRFNNAFSSFASGNKLAIEMTELEFSSMKCKEQDVAGVYVFRYSDKIKDLQAFADSRPSDYDIVPKEDHAKYVKYLQVKSACKATVGAMLKIDPDALTKNRLVSSFYLGATRYPFETGNPNLPDQPGRDFQHREGEITKSVHSARIKLIGPPKDSAIVAKLEASDTTVELFALENILGCALGLPSKQGMDKRFGGSWNVQFLGQSQKREEDLWVIVWSCRRRLGDEFLLNEVPPSGQDPVPGCVRNAASNSVLTEIIINRCYGGDHDADPTAISLKEMHSVIGHHCYCCSLDGPKKDIYRLMATRSLGAKFIRVWHNHVEIGVVSSANVLKSIFELGDNVNYTGTNTVGNAILKSEDTGEPQSFSLESTAYWTDDFGCMRDSRNASFRDKVKVQALRSFFPGEETENAEDDANFDFEGNPLDSSDDDRPFIVVESIGKVFSIRDDTLHSGEVSKLPLKISTLGGNLDLNFAKEHYNQPSDLCGYNRNELNAVQHMLGMFGRAKKFPRSYSDNRCRREIVEFLDGEREG